MNYFRSFVAAFCTACVFAGAVGLLAPRGNMEKSVRYALAVFMLFCILSAAFALGGADFSLDTAEVRADDTAFSELTARQTLAAALESAGVHFSKITVCTDKTEEGGISISEAVVYTSETAERVTEIIGSEEYIVRVVNE